LTITFTFAATQDLFAPPVAQLGNFQHGVMWLRSAAALRIGIMPARIQRLAKTYFRFDAT
jgi:hypothetical protein